MGSFLESGVKVDLPLTKFFHPMDLRTSAVLQIVLETVDQHFKAAAPQHSARRWEYAMALAASIAWKRRRPNSWIDVGGADSPFFLMADFDLSDHDERTRGKVIDPRAGTGTLKEWVAAGGRAEQVYCISTIEHVDHLDSFLKDLAAATIPGGLLFLTSDAWNQEGRDQAHWHWDRKRIFTPQSWHGVMLSMIALGFQPLGEVDLTWNGHVLENWGYNLVSMALRKGS